MLSLVIHTRFSIYYVNQEDDGQHTVVGTTNPSHEHAIGNRCSKPELGLPLRTHLGGTKYCISSDIQWIHEQGEPCDHCEKNQDPTSPRES